MGCKTYKMLGGPFIKFIKIMRLSHLLYNANITTFLFRIILNYTHFYLSKIFFVFLGNLNT